MSIQNNKNTDKQKAVDEDYLMNIISGEQPAARQQAPQTEHSEIAENSEPKNKTTARNRKAAPKEDYEQAFLTNRMPSSRNGKVVYIRQEYHERLLRIVQLTREEKITLYGYIDNILAEHFKEYGQEITEYFNERFKPII